MTLTEKRLAYLRKYRREHYLRVREIEKKSQARPENVARKAVYMRDYLRKNKERIKLQRLENPEKLQARYKLRYEVKMGRIEKLPCLECGNEKSEAHHEDYAKPLEVIWLCRKHHSLRK